MCPEDNLIVKLQIGPARQGEDFLTEAFAHLIRSLVAIEPGAAVRFLAWLGGERVGFAACHPGEVKVRTQVGSETGRPDLEIRASDRRLLVEVKLDAGLGHRQLERYQAELDREAHPAGSALVLLSRYRIQIPEDLQDRVVTRLWFQVADQLRDADIRTEVGRYLVGQFVGFLQHKGMTMEKVEPCVAPGVKAFRHLIDMLGEAMDGLKIDSGYLEASKMDWVGYYIEDRRFFAGFDFDKPTLLYLCTHDAEVHPDALKRAGCGKLEPLSSKRGTTCWNINLDLEDENKGFFAKDKDGQLEILTDFLRRSLAAARRAMIPED
jgi:hypothetical protein